MQGSESEMWAGLVGFFLPVFIAGILKSDWQKTVKAVIAFLVCVVAGLGTAYFAGQVDPTRIAFDVLIVLTMALGFYRLYWYDSGITDWVEKNINP